MSDGNPRGELRETAVVVGVPVRDDEVIDPGKPGVARGLHDSRGVTDRSGPGISSVDQQRLAGRGDHERRIASFHIHDVNVQRLRSLALAREERGAQNDDDEARESEPHRALSFDSCMRAPLRMFRRA